jgi:hypothetical protein
MMAAAGGMTHNSTFSPTPEVPNFGRSFSFGSLACLTDTRRAPSQATSSTSRLSGLEGDGGSCRDRKPVALHRVTIDDERRIGLW